jgi:hypothetical protein
MIGPRREGPGRLPRPAPPAPPAPQAPQAGAGPARPSGLVVFLVTRLTWIAMVAAVTAHLVLAEDEVPFVARVFLAVPAVLVLLEARAYIQGGMRELPLCVWALVQYYLAFSFPVFFDLPFFDIDGPVVFSPETRVNSGIVVALGALSMWAAIRLGFRVAGPIRRFMLRAVPSTELPARWEDVFLGYAAIGIGLLLVTLFFVLPSSVALPISLIFGTDFALALALAIRTRRFGGRSAAILTATIGILGLLRGHLDALFRSGATYVAGEWVNARRFALRVVVTCFVLYAVLQPVKQRYRREVWIASGRPEDQVSLLDRVMVWEHALESFYSGEARTAADEPAPFAERLSELGPLMHAVQVVPGRVDYLMGESFLEILYTPIPRILWPNKPTTVERFQQRYAVIFNLQTAAGAQGTAIGMPLLVEGWWNFGWAGIALVGALLGVWCGAAQRAFAAEHWALRALGFSWFAMTTATGSVVTMYSSVFQLFAGRMIALWAMYWLAKMLSGRQRTAPAIRRRAARPAVTRPAQPAVMGPASTSAARGA